LIQPKGPTSVLKYQLRQAEISKERALLPAYEDHKTKNMSNLTISSYEDFLQYEGAELGVSNYHTITQEQIRTIAHGYLTVSLLPYLWGQIIAIENLKMQVNYEIENLRFNQAVAVDSQVRLHAKLLSLKNLRGIAKAQIGVELEIKDSKKPAFTGVITFLYHFIS
jgi:hypothetical protein